MSGNSLAGIRVTRFLSIRRQEDAAYSDTTSVDDDVEFEFLDVHGEMLFATSTDDDDVEMMDFDNEKDDTTVENNQSFWDDKHQLLQANICRSSCLESRIRNATKDAVREIQSAECDCSKSMGGATAKTTCRNCFMREVSKRLQKAGFNSAICKTKWRTSPQIPSGEHTFLDVIDNTSTKKGDVRVIIELNFRAEFEMGRGNDEYNQLVKRLPEVYVGKVERLSNLIKILSMAAKKCMKERKMHMGPWRKHKYMQAKWLGPCERNTSTATTSLSMGYNSERIVKTKPKASLLTVDLLEKLPNMHCTVVKVV